MREKITIRIAAVLTAVIIAMSAAVPVYADGDNTIPTLTAVVNNGMLTIDAVDDASGIAVIYVNGFEFTELENGSLTIRMQQYDTGYQYFTMQAKDGAGNLSEVYRVNNPYYTFEEEDNGVEDEEPSLPTDAKPTKPSDSEAEVKDHIKTDREGNKKEKRHKSSSSSTKSSSSSSVRKRGIEEDDDKEEDHEPDRTPVDTSEGREFYTIMARSGKIFYLVIDRNGDEEKVHFLTDITENDLLNVTNDNKPTLPQNSAVVIKDAGLADMSAGAGRDGEEPKEKEEAKKDVSGANLLMDEEEIAGISGKDDKSGAVSSNETGKKKGNLIRDNLFIIIACSAVLIVAVVIKLLKRHDPDADYVEDEEGDEEEYEEDQDEENEENDDKYEDKEDEEDGEYTDKEDRATKYSEPKDRGTQDTEDKPGEIEKESEEESEEKGTHSEKKEEESIPEGIPDPDGLYTARSSICNTNFEKTKYDNTEDSIYL